jgi:hypothetical protein
MEFSSRCSRTRRRSRSTGDPSCRKYPMRCSARARFSVSPNVPSRHAQCLGPFAVDLHPKLRLVELEIDVDAGESARWPRLVRGNAAGPQRSVSRVWAWITNCTGNRERPRPSPPGWWRPASPPPVRRPGHARDLQQPPRSPPAIARAGPVHQIQPHEARVHRTAQRRIPGRSTR